jgi:hypothetical protein
MGIFKVKEKAEKLAGGEKLLAVSEHHLDMMGY